jgi:hypothetical protein
LDLKRYIRKEPKRGNKWREKGRRRWGKRGRREGEEKER